jgi:hypothetical protein
MQAGSAHGVGHAELQRVGDQRMADRHLQHARHGAQEVGEVVAVQVVPGIDAQAGLRRGARGGGKALQLRLLPGVPWAAA